MRWGAWALAKLSRGPALALAVSAAVALPSTAALASGGAPGIVVRAPAGVGPSAATLQAQISPDGADTVYSFQYGPTSAYGHVVENPSDRVEAGGASTSGNVSQRLEGLSPGTLYHYRVLATNSQGTTVSDDETFSTFGVVGFNALVAEADGGADLQAGSHPFEVTVGLKLAVDERAGEETPAGAAKDLDIELPPGLVGNPSAIPRCPRAMLNGPLFGVSECPVDTQVGLLRLEIDASTTVTLPVYNLIPPAGTPAQFGVFALLFPVIMDASLRTGGNYGTTVSLENLSQLIPTTGTSLTLWGIPADPAHDPYRGACLSFEGGSTGSCPSGAPRSPFITLPTSCGPPLTIRAQVDSWAQPGEFVGEGAALGAGSGGSSALTGCERLQFNPTVSVGSDGPAVDSPMGLTIDIEMHEQERSALADSRLKEAVIDLPEGVSIDPSVADGLSACSAAEVMLGSSAPAACPDASKIGSAQIDTPLLEEPLSGSIYIARSDDNPFGALLAAYLVTEAEGVLVKLPVQFVVDASSGRISVRLAGIPELPFSAVKLSLHGGPRAALASPDRCGEFAISSRLVPYSEAEGAQPASMESTLVLDGGCGDGFAPSFVAAGTSAFAGAHTAVTLRVGREGGEQHLQRLTVTMPPGLLADLARVHACASAQSAAGTCTPDSRIGVARVAVGAGSHPVYLSGDMFLTGPYGGAPFGLAIALPAKIGPFDLGTTVLRAAVSLDPADLHMVIAADPLPQVIAGVPLRLRGLELTIDRPGFLINPTRCAGARVRAAVGSAEGSDVTLSSPFWVGGCRALSFAPRLSARSPAHATRGGADIRLRLSLPARPGANIRSLLVALGGRLHPRLPAIQQACRAATFHANPAACPPGSLVGVATARTPLLPVPLRGSVRLVFRGGRTYPSLAMELQGNGVSLELDGVVGISDAGVVTTSFNDLPDVPLQTLTLELPRGAHSILGAIGDPCSKAPHVGYRIVGQNGAQVSGYSRVAVVGCPVRAPRRARR